MIRRPPEPARLGLPLLSALALVVAIGTTWLLALAAGDTLGYDYRAYEAAARRLVEGRSLYDPAVDVAGGFAIYLYPPPFVALALPFALLGPELGLWAWTGGLLVAFVVGALAMPVRPEVRWLTVLLGGLMWPMVYSIKLGQVGPILFLLFALGWRWLDRPGALGATIGLGTLIKLQPALLFGWCVATRRWRAALVGVVLLALAALAFTPAVGIDGWLDYASLLRRVGDPIATPHTVSPGAIAYQLGAPHAVAGAVQWASVAFVIAVTAWSWVRAPAGASYVVTVVASQLLSPLLWDHYAMLLLLPVAFLLNRGHWYAAAIPLVMSVPLVGWVPAWSYPVLLGLGLLAPPLADRRPVAGGASSDGELPALSRRRNAT